MLSTELIPIKRLAGELLISQSRNQYRCLLTTQELVFQKPHTTYHLLLQDILGVTSHPMEGLPANNPWKPNEYYKITTKELSVIQRSGIYQREATDLILPIHDRILQWIRQIHDWTEFS